MSSLAFYVCVSHIFEKNVAHSTEALGLLFLYPRFNKARCVKNRTISR